MFLRQQQQDQLNRWGVPVANEAGPVKYSRRAGCYFFGKLQRQGPALLFIRAAFVSRRCAYGPSPAAEDCRRKVQRRRVPRLRSRKAIALMNARLQSLAAASRPAPGR